LQTGERQRRHKHNKDKQNTQGKAFKELRDELLAGNACAYPNFGKEFIFKLDGCDTIVGAVLTHGGNGNHEKIIACTSQKLNPSKAKWCAYDREV
jgi:hypothetical protein